MADERTTQPMLEALLEGQRQFAAQLTELMGATASLSVKVDALATRQDEFAARLDEFGAKQDEFAARLDGFAARQDEFAARLDGFAARQDEFAARQDDLAARQERLELAVIELTREVRYGFDDTNRKIDVLNSRLLTFETRLQRIDDRLHDEILFRTR